MSTFDELVIYTTTGNRHRFDCPKGLWGVDAGCKEEAEREARHYFMQYDADGEYDGTLFDKLYEKYGKQEGNDIKGEKL